ncbi:MAG TPA: hypothetical protein VGM92_06980 [Candidatus Kapabacteria bacterium]|jgi:hypothetical protein
MTTPAEALAYAEEVTELEKNATPGFIVIENSTDLFTECGEESLADVRQIADYQVDAIPYAEMRANAKLAMLLRNSAPTALRILAERVRELEEMMTPPSEEEQAEAFEQAIADEDDVYNAITNEAYQQGYETARSEFERN